MCQHCERKSFAFFSRHHRLPLNNFASAVVFLATASSMTCSSLGQWKEIF